MRSSIPVLFVLAACSDKPAAQPDAAIDDAAIDAVAVDAPIDAMIDAPPDAPSSSPRCATAPQILIDVAPRRLGNVARVGTTLYLSAYQYDGSMVSDAVVIALDLATNQPIGDPMPMPAATALYEGAGIVLATTSQTDLWRIETNTPPTKILTGRPTLSAPTTDGTYLYWVEDATFGSDIVQRRLIAGGPIETIGTCNSAMKTMVSGGRLYCVGSDGVYGMPVAGGTVDALHATNINLYPVFSAQLVDDALYFPDLYVRPRLHRAPLPAGPSVLIHELPNLPDTYHAIGISDDYVYTVARNSGIRRVHRTDYSVEPVYDDAPVGGEPFVWNDRLYFQSGSPTESGLRYVRYCVD